MLSVANPEELVLETYFNYTVQWHAMYTDGIVVAH